MILSLKKVVRWRALVLVGFGSAARYRLYMLITALNGALRAPCPSQLHYSSQINRLRNVISVNQRQTERVKKASLNAIYILIVQCTEYNVCIHYYKHII